MESNKRLYYIEYTEAMALLANGQWLKGDNFAQGCYLKCSEEKGLVLVDVTTTFNTETPFNMLNSLSRQKFRIVNIATVKELKK